MRAPFLARALVLAARLSHARYHAPSPAEAANVLPQLVPGVVPGLVDQVGVAADLGVPAHPAAGLVPGEPVVVPGADRDPQGQADRDHAIGDQLREVLSRYVGGERALERHRPRRPHRGADGLEFEASGREGPDRQRHANDAMPAKLYAFGRHPPDPRPAGRIQRLDQRRVGRPGSRTRHRPGRALVAGPACSEPVGTTEIAIARTAVTAAVPEVVNRRT